MYNANLKKRKLYYNFEIIVVDDGSTDDCMDSIRDVVDQRIRIFHQENSGKEGAGARVRRGHQEQAAGEGHGLAKEAKEGRAGERRGAVDPVGGDTPERESSASSWGVISKFILNKKITIISSLLWFCEWSR